MVYTPNQIGLLQKQIGFLKRLSSPTNARPGYLMFPLKLPDVGGGD
jgi:hypothetical protein